MVRASQYSSGAGWIDPCQFWDEDGRAYLVAGVAKSRIGYKSVLHMIEMQPDGMGLIGEAKVVFDGNLNEQETIEGPKLYKRNGWYYIFAPAGGVKQDGRLCFAQEIFLDLMSIVLLCVRVIVQ